MHFLGSCRCGENKMKQFPELDGKTTVGREEGERTSARSSAELTALCCSGGLRRFFTEPFLHSSMIPSLEPVETVESCLGKKRSHYCSVVMPEAATYSTKVSRSSWRWTAGARRRGGSGASPVQSDNEEKNHHEAKHEEGRKDWCLPTGAES